MGIETKTIEIVTCDICSNTCSKYDGKIEIRINGGCIDSGPAIIHGELKFNQPYGATNGVVCSECKTNYLIKYLGQEA